MKDMRDFVNEASEKGLCKRITAEVDWNLELSHIAKLNEEASGPALLFENVKDYSTPVITSVCTTTERLALIMGQPLDSTLVNLYDAWAKLGENLIPPKFVDKASAPCKENILTGDQIDLYKFPVPHWYPMDGGRYIGTAHFFITKDPESGWVNLGTYRAQLLGKDKMGTQFIKGKHADIMLKKYQAMGKPMPVASIIGCDPLLFILGAARVSAFVSEYDVAGALRRTAVEVVQGETVDLPIPAHAEIVIEGEVDADKFMEEGPFGEYTGYYSGVGTDPRNFVDVKCVTHRNNPILWGTTVGPRGDRHPYDHGAFLRRDSLAAASGYENTGSESGILPARGFGQVPGHHLHETDVSRPRGPGADGRHLYGNGRLWSENRDRGGRRHRSLGHSTGNVRTEFQVPAQPFPGHQEGPVHSVGSFSAHQRQGYHGQAALGCHHTL